MKEHADRIVITMSLSLLHTYILLPFSTTMATPSSPHKGVHHAEVDRHRLHAPALRHLHLLPARGARQPLELAARLAPLQHFKPTQHAPEAALAERVPEELDHNSTKPK